MVRDREGAAVRRTIFSHEDWWWFMVLNSRLADGQHAYTGWGGPHWMVDYLRWLSWRYGFNVEMSILSQNTWWFTPLVTRNPRPRMFSMPLIRCILAMTDFENQRSLLMNLKSHCWFYIPYAFQIKVKLSLQGAAPVVLRTISTCRCQTIGRPNRC